MGRSGARLVRLAIEVRWNTHDKLRHELVLEWLQLRWKAIDGQARRIPHIGRSRADDASRGVVRWHGGSTRTGSRLGGHGVGSGFGGNHHATGEADPRIVPRLYAFRCGGSGHRHTRRPHGMEADGG